MKPQNFLEEDWDYIFVLDSARYDVFSEIYSDYFEGELEKRRSRASATPEWAAKILEGRHKINYFSSNPFINSAGIPLKEVGDVNYEVVPSRHITNIIDLWDIAWDKESGTVKPGDVNREVRSRINELSGKRTVIHYMQPHVPFLGRGKGRLNKYLQKNFLKLKERDTQKRLLNRRFLKGIPEVVGRFEDTELLMKLGLYSSLDPRSLLEVVKGDSRKKLMEFHRENQKEVLRHVRDLVEDLEGKVVITSDHGDAFGEQGVWGHHVETHIPPLIEVPWLEVNTAN